MNDQATLTPKPARTPVLEFEDSWGSDTENKAPAKPVDIAPPISKDKPKEVAAGDIGKTVGEDQPAGEKKGLSAGLSAEFTTMGIDTIQSLVFKMVNNKKIVRRIGRENIVRFGDLLTELNEGKKILDQITDDEKILFWKFRRLKQVEEDIPFTNGEYDKMNEVLEKYYKETNTSMPPWLGLAIALSGIIGERISDAINE